jgi:hypothetical protein
MRLLAAIMATFVEIGSKRAEPEITSENIVTRLNSDPLALSFAQRISWRRKQVDNHRSSRSYCAFIGTGMKSSLRRKYTTTMQSAPSSHLSSWTCLAGCDRTDPGSPVCGAAPSKICVNLPWITTP